MKILFITLSNIGDCILTLSVLDLLIDKYKDAEFSVICGPRAEEVFIDNQFIKKIIIYDKKSTFKNKLKLVTQLYRERYDLAIDLRHTLFPFFLKAHIGSKLFNSSKNIIHARDKHFSRLKNYLLTDRQENKDKKNNKKYFFQEHNNKFNEYRDFVLVAPGTRSHLKRWRIDGFAKVCDRIVEVLGLNIILVGENEDSVIANEILSKMKKQAINLVGKTSLAELADLIVKSKLIISCDSACLHLSSYLNIPIVSIFGPTDARKYGPWSEKNIVVRKRIRCAPCQNAGCKIKTFDCMLLLGADEVFKAVEKIIESTPPLAGCNSTG